MKHKNIYRISISLLLAFVMALPTIAQNTKTFKGVVLDETEQPIIGAAIKVVGTTVGTITDLDGNFTLNVPDGKEVEISYIGYVPQRFSAPFKLTKIILKEDTQQLDEVVVVGYGTQKKAHLTGAIATVPVDDIQDISSGSLASTLSGLANGISVNGGDTRPGQNATITIRQNGELEEMGGTNLQPLYVIDGYIYPTEVKVGSTYTNLGAEAFNNLDPSVVESISILKDASAAVYGARAANGVILVTTKKGKLGAPKISYNGTFGITDEVSRPKMLNAYEYGKLWNAVRMADPTETSIDPLRAIFQQDELNAMKSLHYDLLDKYWVLYTMSKEHEEFAIRRLKNQKISYMIQEVGTNKINLFFGKPECMEAMRHIIIRPLNQLTAEEDFILGAMLGYDLCQQCKRYCSKKEGIKMAV